MQVRKMLAGMGSRLHDLMGELVIKSNPCLQVSVAYPARDEVAGGSSKETGAQESDKGMVSL